VDDFGYSSGPRAFDDVRQVGGKIGIIQMGVRVVKCRHGSVLVLQLNVALPFKSYGAMRNRQFSDFRLQSGDNPAIAEFRHNQIII
jgi:hypothetical protein